MLSTSLLLLAGWWALLGRGAFVAVGEALVALGVAFVVPLGFALSAREEASGELPRGHTLGAGLVSLGAPCGVASLLWNPGREAAALAGVWLLATLAVALLGLRRLLRRGLGPLEELSLDAGHLYLPVGAVWLVASRAGVPLLGFHEPIVLYTAAHFHFAGFAAPVLLGLLGRELALRPDPAAPGAPVASALLARVYRGAALVVLAGVPLVAVGITVSHALEAPSAVLLGSGMLAASMLLARAGLRRLTGRAPAVSEPTLLAPAVSERARAGLSRLSGLLLLLAGLSLVLSMGLAVTFALTGSAGRGARAGLVSYETMAALHGVANALGFALCGLVAFGLAPPRPRSAPAGGSFPRRSSRGFVGPRFFDREGLVDASREVRGQLESLEDFAQEGFEPARVAPEVRAFYERTREYALRAAPEWYAPFRLAARLFHRFARRMLGQLVLPVEPEGEELVRTRLFALRDPEDPRPSLRGYVRSYGDGDAERANYVAAYGLHRGARRVYLSCAFPLPWSSLLGVLRPRNGERAGELQLTSRAEPGEFEEDEGMFLVTPLGVLRLPLEERLRVWLEGATLHATHEVWLLGLRCVTLRYELLRGGAE